jgi:hypothetical protein
MITIQVNDEIIDLLKKLDVASVTCNFGEAKISSKYFFEEVLPKNIYLAIELLKYSVVNDFSFDGFNECAKYCDLYTVQYIVCNWDKIPNFGILVNACDRIDDNPEILDYLVVKYGTPPYLLNDYYVYRNLCRNDNKTILKYVIDFVKTPNHSTIYDHILKYGSFDCFSMIFVERYVDKMDRSLFDKILSISDHNRKSKFLEMLIEFDNSGLLPEIHQMIMAQISKDASLKELVISQGFIDKID